MAVKVEVKNVKRRGGSRIRNFSPCSSCLISQAFGDMETSWVATRTCPRVLLGEGEIPADQALLGHINYQIASNHLNCLEQPRYADALKRSQTPPEERKKFEL